MMNRKSLNKALALTSCSDKKSEHPNTALNNFSVIEDLSITKESCLKSKPQSDSMSIFIVTKGREKAILNHDQVNIQHSMVHQGANIMHKIPIKEQSFLLSGVSFTCNFIKETEITPYVSPYIFGLFSSGSFVVLELNHQDAIIVKHQIRFLAEHARIFRGHPFGKEILVHAFLVFLFEIEALRLKQAGPTNFPSSRQEIHVQKFQNLVQQKFREVRTIKDYASQLNVSAKYLTEIVKQSTGRNASEMVTEQVIKEAKFLLKNPQLSIGEIAYKLHFSDPSFFGKYFKRLTGVAPKTYRESVFLSRNTTRTMIS